MGGTRKVEETKPETPVLDLRSIGDGLVLLKESRIELTREKAHWLLNLKEFVGDRPLRNGHVDYLVSTMKRGTFRPEQVGLATCRLDGEVYRMNGQHTAWAREGMPDEYPCKVRLLEYEAKTYDDMRMLYASIDRASPRTKKNVIDSYLMGLPEFDGIKAKTLEYVPAGYALFKWPSGKDRKRHDGDSVAYHMRQVDSELVLRVTRFLDGYSTRAHKHLFRSSVVAAVLLTFQKVPTIAPDFWRPVADGVGFERALDPRNRLRSELIQSSVTTGSAEGKKRVTAEWLLRVCITLWNAWREEREVKQLKVSDKGRRPSVQ